MTVFPIAVVTNPEKYQTLDHPYQEPCVDFRSPSKAAWVIRESTYYEPDRIHEFDE